MNDKQFRVLRITKLFGDGPILIDSFLKDAIEVDVDALADADGEGFVAGIMEHIEEAGIHSGDSACSLPPYSLSQDVIARIRQQTETLARALSTVGSQNVLIPLVAVVAIVLVARRALRPAVLLVVIWAGGVLDIPGL